MALGSRPARRGSVEPPRRLLQQVWVADPAQPAPGIESLRAIPWVFSWSQARIGLPAWYGLGSALEAYRKAHGQQRATDKIAALYRDWPFLASALDNAELILYPIRAADRAAVRGPGRDGRRASGCGLASWRSTSSRSSELAKVTGHTELLEDRSGGPAVDPAAAPVHRSAVAHPGPLPGPTARAAGRPIRTASASRRSSSSPSTACRPACATPARRPHRCPRPRRPDAAAAPNRTRPRACLRDGRRLRRGPRSRGEPARLRQRRPSRGGAAAAGRRPGPLQPWASTSWPHRWARSMASSPIGAEAMRGADRRAQALGVAGTRLMEHAGCAVAAATRALAVETERWGRGPILILCGPGNNGGDGFVAARHLSRHGAKVVAVLVAAEGRPVGKDAARNWDRLEAERSRRADPHPRRPRRGDPGPGHREGLPWSWTRCWAPVRPGRCGSPSAAPSSWSPERGGPASRFCRWTAPRPST